MRRISHLGHCLQSIFIAFIIVSLCGVGALPPACARDLSQFADGEQDATQALQALIDTNPGAVRLPPGAFRISQSLQIDLSQVGPVHISGSAATRIVMAGAGPAFLLEGSHFKSANPDGFDPQIWKRERMPIIEGLAIEGAHPEADGIRAIGTMQLTCVHLHLRKLRHGIHLTENNRNVILNGCHIYENSGIGVFFDDVNLHQSNITGCHISYCDGGGIVTRAGNVRNIHIVGCDLESNMSADSPATANVLIDCRGSKYGTAEVTISGCTLQHNDEGPRSANIRVMGASSSAVAKSDASNQPQREGHVTITGNVLSDVHTNVHLDQCRGVVLTGNTFWMGFDHNLLVENSSNVVVGANNFDRNPRYNYGNSLDAKNCLVFRNCQDCTLTGLHIAHVWNSRGGLILKDCERFHLSGLTILDCDQSGVYLENVQRSQFGSCLIRDDRKNSTSVPVMLRGGILDKDAQNQFDDSWSSYLGD